MIKRSFVWLLLAVGSQLALNCALACSRVAARTPPKSQSV